MKKRKIKVPTEYSDRFKEMWHDDEGVWASAAPGWCFDTLGGYLLCADSKNELLAQAAARIRPEEYEVRDMTGERVNTISYRKACSLLPHLRLGYTIISTSTGESFERIQPAVYRRFHSYNTLELEDGTTIYSCQEYSLTVREQREQDGSISLLPVDGAVASISKSWEELPEAGLNAACLSLELQINRKAQEKSGEALPLVRVTGDRSHPLVAALLDAGMEKLAGLIEILPADDAELSVTEIPRMRPSYLKAVNDISQLLQNHGYEDASKFLDFSCEL